MTENTEVRWGTLASATLAGGWTLFHLLWVINHQTGDDFWGSALLVLFLLTLMLAVVRYLPERKRLRAGVTSETYPEPSLARYFFASTGTAGLWFIIRMDVGATWLLAGWGKITSPRWGTSGITLKGVLTAALSKKASPNLLTPGWYTWFLQHVALAHVGLFSFLVSWGELLIGLAILAGALTGIASGLGLLLNLNYLLADAAGIDPILGMLLLFLCLSWRVCGWIGVDRALLPRLGLPWQAGPWLNPADMVRELTRTSPLRRP